MSSSAEIHNPVLALPAPQRLRDLSPEERAPLRALWSEIRARQHVELHLMPFAIAKVRAAERRQLG